MQIVKTMEDLYTAIGSQTVGCTAIDKKSNASNLHAGHLDLINYAKANYDISLVSFWDGIELIYYFYPEQRIADDITQVWDSTGCYAWCEANGVDIVMSPDLGYTATYLHDYDKYISIANTQALWLQRGYPVIEGDGDSYFNSAKAVMAYLDWDPKTSGWSYLNTWKDGCSRYVLADHLNRVREDYYVLLDPIKNSDGLYYSTLSQDMSQGEIDIAVQIPDVVDSVGYSDEYVLQEALRDLDPGGTFNFEPYRIHVTYGGIVGEANDFIEVFYSFGNYPSGKSRADIYPIRKLNVR